MWIHLLAGCPFVFGPPDLSRVDLVATTDDEQEPIDTEPTTPDVTAVTGVTGDTGPEPIPPEITSVSADRSIDGFTFTVDVEDPDGDMSGGDLTIEGAGPTPIVLGVPEDVTLAAGQMSFVVPGGDPCGSWEYNFQVVAHDAVGNPSLAMALGAVGTGSGTGGPGAWYMDLGQVDLNWAVCGSVDAPNETDTFQLSVPADYQALVSVTWDGNTNTDLDVTVYDQQAFIVATGSSVLEPELVEVPMNAGETYQIRIYHYGGPRPQLYQVALLPAP